MDTLRVILIIFGILLVAGIYLADRFKRDQSKKMMHHRDGIDLDMLSAAGESFSTAEESFPVEWSGNETSISARRHQPLADDQLNDLKGLNGANAETDATAPSRPSDQGSLPETVIVLTVMAREDKRFSGPLLLRVLQEAGLAHGGKGLFHYHPPGINEPLFSVANILEPGRFELSEIATLQTPGLALFMRLPAAVDGEQALQILLRKSRQIAAQLSGSLCDEQRRRLDEERLARIGQLARRYGQANSAL